MHHQKCQGDDSDNTLWLHPKKGMSACFSDTYSQEMFPVHTAPPPPNLCLFPAPFAPLDLILI